LTKSAYPTKKEVQVQNENSPDKMELKVGKILEAAKHPDADTLCVLKVDVSSGITKSVNYR
jgi:tyrosyl-tRNA synthetase